MFEGGFLGLDNIGVFDRSAPLPTGGHIDQADGTAWMAMFSHNMLRLAIELAASRPAATRNSSSKFLRALLLDRRRHEPSREQPDGMWDEADGFYYDCCCLPDGSALRLKVRSMVGLLPLCRHHIFEQVPLERFRGNSGPDLPRLPALAILSFSEYPPDGVAISEINGAELHCHGHPGGACAGYWARCWTRTNFFGPHGIRSQVSRNHREPFYFPSQRPGITRRLPARRVDSGMFGGNSNWRGPVWMPVNTMIIRALLNFYHVLRG